VEWDFDLFVAVFFLRDVRSFSLPLTEKRRWTQSQFR